jgi:hypothetical protein
MSPHRASAYPSTIRAAIRIGSIAATLTFSVLLPGCGKSGTSSSAAPIGTRSDVTVTFDGKRRKCAVKLSSEAQGSSISCDDVVPFVKEELRLPSGSFYDIRTGSEGDEGEIDKIRASLNSAGYRLAGGSQ